MKHCAEDVWIAELSNNKIPGNWNITKTNIQAAVLPQIFIVFPYVFLFPSGKMFFTNCNSKKIAVERHYSRDAGQVQ